MAKKLKVIFFFLFLFFLVSLFSAQSAHALVIISEFSSASDVEWIELLNEDQSSSVTLTNWTIRETSTNNSVTLSGSIPRGGFLTFEFSAGSLPDTGGHLVLSNEGGVAQYGVSYGDYTPQETNRHVNAPSLTQSGALNPDNNSWGVTDSPTKGWCGEGFGTCPTVATIVAQIGNEGVTTNLGEMSDYSRTSSLYFEKTGYGRISFLAEINFTDRDALSWMQTLDQKLDMNTKARIALDADLIKNLVDTRASLTMYGLTLNNPRILVDGQEDTGGIVSGLSYNQATGTLTFTATHFTTFTAVETTTSTTTTTSAGAPPGCGDQPPGLKKPHLYLIKTDKNSATLYFTPADDPVSYYFIAYGLSVGEERFGVSFPHGSTKDVISYKINDLSPLTDYYFKVRAGNGCATGGWSNELLAKTEGGVEVLKTEEGTLAEQITTLPKTSSEEDVLGEEEMEEDRQATGELEVPSTFEETSTPPPVQAELKLSLFQKILRFFQSLFR